LRPLPEPDSGTYQVLFSLCSETRIRVGALGEIVFPKGSYLYTGRASKGMQKRIQRHLCKNKRLRWHIDYFTAHARAVWVWVYPAAADEECFINKTVAGLNHMDFPVQGFGSSDCKCISHLAYLHFPRLRNE
jgi:sugar fermentation stimulation protein A